MILASKIGKHTRQGLKRKYEQMEWQNEQIRFFSNSSVFGVGFGNRDKGGERMTAILTAIILFTGGVLVGGIMVESKIKQKLNKGGFVIISNEIYLCKKVMLVDASEMDDDENQS